MTQPDVDIEAFKAALRADDDQSILDRFYYGSPAAMLTREQEAGLRRAIAVKFSVSMRDIIITGSAKLGFTIVPKPDRPAFSRFGDGSDIDVTIISTPLFLSLWSAALQFYRDQGEWSRSERFRRYLMKGWLRPDQLPIDPDFTQQGDWFEFFRGLTDSGLYGPYQINGGVYYDETFWESYAANSLSKSRLELEQLA